MLTKIWHISSDELATYTPGMELGEPHEVKDIPARWTWSDDDRDTMLLRIKRGHETRLGGRPALRAEIYRDLRDEGLSDQEIAERYDIKLSTLRQYKTDWRREELLHGQRNAESSWAGF